MTEVVIRTRLWRDGVLEKEDFAFEELSDYLDQPGCLVWADLQAPDEALLAELGVELSLDKLAIEDAVAHHERPKSSRYPTHTFLTARALRLDRESGELSDLAVSAFVLKQALVTVHAGQWFDIDTIVKRWDENAELMRHGVKALVWGMLDVLVDGHFEVVQSLDDEIEDLEDLLFDQSNGVHQLQRRTFALRKSLVRTRRAVLPMREVVNTLARRDNDIPHELRPYFDDLYDHVLRATEWTESLRDMVSSVFETNLSLQDARLNTILKKLTSFTALIAIPTAVTGFYGQNVPYPGFGQHSGFISSVVVISVLAGALYLAFKRAGWL
ncbi:MAG TPA: magnesium transporter CorA family protein [Jatrophihabitans sp.]|jgi:magnesium transporter|uniref:magnesium transporter CorA family protein n=1 Tax=Jatrophihabitans sp. TaxID=1932789 RepID=UPI002EF00F08